MIPASGALALLDGERINLSAGEHLKFCRARDAEGLFSQMVYRVTDPSGKTQVVDTDGATNLLAEGALSLHVGLVWQSPFRGEFWI